MKQRTLIAMLATILCAVGFAPAASPRTGTTTGTGRDTTTSIGSPSALGRGRGRAGRRRRDLLPRRACRIRVSDDDGSAAAATTTGATPAAATSRRTSSPRSATGRATTRESARATSRSGVNAVGVIPGRAVDYFFGVGLGVHFLDTQIDGVGAQPAGLVDESDAHFGGNFQVGLDVHMSRHVSLFGTGRLRRRSRGGRDPAGQGLHGPALPASSVTSASRRGRRALLLELPAAALRLEAPPLGRLRHPGRAALLLRLSAPARSCASRATAASRFAACVRWRCEETWSTPSRLMRVPRRSRMRSRCSSSRLGEPSTSKRTVDPRLELVDVLAPRPAAARGLQLQLGVRDRQGRVDLDHGARQGSIAAPPRRAAPDPIPGDPDELRTTPFRSRPGPPRSSPQPSRPRRREPTPSPPPSRPPGTTPTGPRSPPRRRAPRATGRTRASCCAAPP